jgi:hypothetical protein
MAVYKPDMARLSKQIMSIRQQSIEDWLCVIGIDGADAVTCSRVLDLTKDDRRFVVHEFPDRVGFYRNFERVLALVDRGTAWVALADQDDVWYPEKLTLLLSHLEPVSMVLGQARIVEVSETLPHPCFLGTTDRAFFSTGELLLDNVVSGALSVFKTELLSLALPFPSGTDVAYHDHWLGLCAALDKGIADVPDAVQDYVQHGGNVIGEGNSSVTKRVSILLSRGAGIWGAVRYHINHRWRWRVYMSRLALSRFTNLNARDKHALEAFAADRLTSRLTAMSVASFARGKCSKFRVISIWIASILAPAISEEVQVEA